MKLEFTFNKPKKEEHLSSLQGALLLFFYYSSSKSCRLLSNSVNVEQTG